MQCIVCGTSSAGHRIVVTVDSGAPVGGFCHGCESAVFGDCFDRFRAASDGQCVACEREAAYAFLDWLDRTGDATGPSDREVGSPGAGPAVDPVPDRTPAVDASATDASATDAADGVAPRFCRTHFQALTSESSDWGREHGGPPIDPSR